MNAPTLSRRAILSAAPALAALVGLPVASEEAPSASVLVEWDRLSERTRCHVLADYWRSLSPDEKQTANRLFRANGLDAIADALCPEWTGPGIYEFRLVDRSIGERHVVPVAFLDRAPERDGPLTGRWFYWRHYFNGRFEGRRHFLPESRIEIVGKKEAFA